jgi:hypothetical protein
MRILIIVLSLLFAVNLFADDGGLNTVYPRVVACQTPGAYSYIEIFHDQAGFMGAPVNPTGIVIIWSTAEGKDTQKRVLLDVPMKHVATGSTSCDLDVKWAQKKYNGTHAIANFHVVVEACNLLNHTPKGNLTEDDVYPDGKIVTTKVDLMCQTAKK